jgi:hypothetical protein
MQAQPARLLEKHLHVALKTKVMGNFYIACMYIHIHIFTKHIMNMSLHTDYIYSGSTDGTVVEVAVVYFRAGYSPDDYPSEREWDARRLVER